MKRLVENKSLQVSLNRSSDIPFTLDTRRAVTLDNRLTARLKLIGETATGKTYVHLGSVTKSFAVPLAADPWSDYQIIMWQRQSAAQYSALKRIGITAGRVQVDRETPTNLNEHDIEPLVRDNLPWYVENIATDFYSAYHRWSPHHPVNWRFLKIEKLYHQNPDVQAALIRHPSLSDPAWLGLISQRVRETVAAYRPWHPLYYNLADEPGIANTAAYWDFDFSKPSLSAMRLWLKKQYGSLRVLNAEWGTRFTRWNHVLPETTREAMRRPGDNFAPWADFKAWMDYAFAHALRVGANAVHAADSDALAGIEGGQPPGWGGYDYSLLSKAVDVMELYNGQNNIAIVHSLNPKIILLTTLFKSGAPAERQVWRELLKGTRGLILWDPNNGFALPDGDLGPRGQAATPYFKQIQRGIGALIINSNRDYDPVAILYSPASFRIQWMLDWRGKGDAWSYHSLAASYADNAVRAATRNFVQAMGALNLTPRFVSDQMVERGDLRRNRYRLLLLPDAIALSRREAAQIRSFVDSGGVVLADHMPGLFDQHGRRLKHSYLGQLMTGIRLNLSDPLSRRFQRLYLAAPIGKELKGARPHWRGIGSIVRMAGIRSPIMLSYRKRARVAHDVEVYRYRDGRVSIFALLRGLTKAVPESGCEASRDARQTKMVDLKLPQKDFVYAIQKGRFRGLDSSLEVSAGCYSPTILAISPVMLPSLKVIAPSRMRPGGTAKIRLRFSGPSPARTDVIHVEIIAPSGRLAPPYSRNVLMQHGKATMMIPFALNDRSGVWLVHARDILSGHSTNFGIELVPVKKSMKNFKH